MTDPARYKLMLTPHQVPWSLCNNIILQPCSLEKKSRMDTELYQYALYAEMTNVNMLTL